MDKLPILTVTELNTIIKQTLNTLGTFIVAGEITELTITTKKGVYITLSDKKSNITLSGYAPTIKNIDLVSVGMTVSVQGFVDMYVPYGSISFSILKIEPKGEGALLNAYEKLKAKLKDLGYFDDKYKMQLPRFIQKIALLTGKDSAAYSDFIKILKENNQHIIVDYYPIIVQGENAVESILSTLLKLTKEEYDTVVLTRGGGSLEDLKSFNDEQIVSELFKLKIPKIVGVGHEKDESLCDFVADVRASTPSQCAYYIVNRNNEYVKSVNDALLCISNKVKLSINSKKLYTDQLISKIRDTLRQRVLQTRQKIVNYESLIKAYDVQKILNRGFSIVKSGKEIISDSSKIDIQKPLQIRFGKGKVEINLGKGTLLKEI